MQLPERTSGRTKKPRVQKEAVDDEDVDNMLHATEITRELVNRHRQRQLAAQEMIPPKSLCSDCVQKFEDLQFCKCLDGLMEVE